MEVIEQLHVLTAFPPVKERPVPFVMRLGGSHCQSIHCGEEQSLMFLPGTEPCFLNWPAHSIVAVPTTPP